MADTVPPSSLLLLPVPTSWTQASLRTACGPTLSNVLSFAGQSVKGTNTISRLDIAVVLPESVDIRDTPRATLFNKVQTLLEELYTLICASAVEHGVELDFPGGVDARIFMLEAVRQDTAESKPESYAYSGPLLNLSTLVSARRAYDPVFSVESEQGEHVLQVFLQLHSVLPKPSSPNVRRIIGGTSMTTSSEKSTTSEAAESTTQSPPAHTSVAVGGTFDHLHIGHKLLLTCTALALSPSKSDRLITIGITGDELLTKKKFASEVESWGLRQQRTADFFESIFAFPASKDVLGSRLVQKINRPGPNGHLTRITLLSHSPTPTSSASATTIDYTRISDPYGPTITNPTISALVISAETRAGGAAVNEKRAEKGWAPLQVFEVDVLDSTPSRSDADAGEMDGGGHSGGGGTFESKISSTEIRRRLVDLKLKDQGQGHGQDEKSSG